MSSTARETSGSNPSIRAVVVDDEPLARSDLARLLRGDPQIALVRECGSAAEAVAAIREVRPQLVLLDVEMPGYDGFELLELLGGDCPDAIVFVTAYDSYALRAFDAGALDYLLKPFDRPRFVRAIERAKQRIVQVAGGPRCMDFLVAKRVGRVDVLNVREIDWIESADYYSRVHVGDESYLVRRSMTDLERDLSGDEFCRIHRSAIVRLERVRGFELNVNGEYDVRLLDGTLLRCSRRYRKALAAGLRVRRPSR